MHTAEFAALTSESPNPPPPPARVPFLTGAPWVAAGGALGALLRWGLAQLLPATTTFTLVDLPWGTFLANVFGCGILGVMTGILDVRPLRRPQLQLALGVGFCGGFTTMSTFVLEVLAMLGASFPLEAFQYTVTSMAFALFAVVVGFLVGRVLMQQYLGRATEAPQAPEFVDDFDDVPSHDVTVGAVGLDDAGEKR